MPEVLSAKPGSVAEPINGSQAGSSKKSSHTAWITVSFWALAIFAVINFVLWMAYGEEKTSSKDLWGGTGSIDLALDDLKNLPGRPNVVLLGSSLVMYPFWSMDKEADSSIYDIFHHHRSHTLEKHLAGAGFDKPTVFNLAIFGQMASDAYIYVNEYLKGDKKPDYLVLGIAPRDFSDYDLPSPIHTFTFKRLVGLKNFPNYQDLYLPNWMDKADFICTHTCFFYGKRWRLQKEIDKALEKFYQASNQMLGLATTEVKPKQAQQAGFMLDGSVEDRWKNSTEEYRRRYRNIADRDLSIQMGFLDRLMTVCRERGIKVVLVNMPLTGVNRQLLPAGFYQHFEDTIGQMAAKDGAAYVPLGANADFNDGDFWDTTHLNHSGGHKLVAHILPHIKK